jgi:hypothetical protein
MIISFFSGMFFLFGVEMLALAWLRSVAPASSASIDKPVVALGVVSLIMSAAALIWQMS